MRTKAKRDAIEPDVVAHLEAIGVQVFRLSDPGGPDLLCYDPRARTLHRYAREFTDDGTWLPIECKSGKAGRLTEAQTKARRTMPWPVCRSVAEALQLFGVTA